MTGSSRPNIICSSPQLTSLPLAANKQQHAQHTPEAGLSQSVKAKVQRVLKKVLQPKAATTAQHVRHLRHSADKCGQSRLSGYGQAAEDEYKRQAAVPEAHQDPCFLWRQQQAEALKASSRAVLRGLDWADTQLSCSTTLPAAPQSAPSGSTGSISQPNPPATGRQQDLPTATQAVAASGRCKLDRWCRAASTAAASKQCQ